MLDTVFMSPFDSWHRSFDVGRNATFEATVYPEDIQSTCGRLNKKWHKQIFNTACCPFMGTHYAIGCFLLLVDWPHLESSTLGDV